LLRVIQVYRRWKKEKKKIQELNKKSNAFKRRNEKEQQ
jgi:uncharacterized protein YjiS (DUF1127 family)